MDKEFSATQLQDYIDCQRRYQLKYINQQSWPAIPGEPIRLFEEHIKRGRRFHYIINQYFSGLPIEFINNIDKDEKVLFWFKAFLKYIDTFNFQKTYSEFMLTSKLPDYSLTAVYDLIAVHADGSISIFDWKTSNRVPRESILKSKIQSRLYPFILFNNSSEIHGNKESVPTEKLKMIYWFPQHPQKTIELYYDVNEHQETQIFLTDLISKILGRAGSENYPMTKNDQLCEFCQFRSLCKRGATAGDFLKLDNQDLEFEDISIDFDSIPEISPDL